MSNMSSKTRMVRVSDKMQKGYSYELVAPMGKDFAPDFRPDLSPKQILALGVFGGVYMRDCAEASLAGKVFAEFPKDWFMKAKLAPHTKSKKAGKPSHDVDKKINYFGVLASQPLSVWRKNGWIHQDDPRGWFQWYCRYYMGRRLPDTVGKAGKKNRGGVIEGEDTRQIKRWKAMRSHIGQIVANCRPGDTVCRPKQRQALLHWGYDLRK